MVGWVEGVVNAPPVQGNLLVADGMAQAGLVGLSIISLYSSTFILAPPYMPQKLDGMDRGIGVGGQRNQLACHEGSRKILKFELTDPTASMQKISAGIKGTNIPTTKARRKIFSVKRGCTSCRPGPQPGPRRAGGHRSYTGRRPPQTDNNGKVIEEETGHRPKTMWPTGMVSRRNNGDNGLDKLDQAEDHWGQEACPP